MINHQQALINNSIVLTNDAKTFSILFKKYDKIILSINKKYLKKISLNFLKGIFSNFDWKSCKLKIYWYLPGISGGGEITLGPSSINRYLASSSCNPSDYSMSSRFIEVLNIFSIC